MTWSCGQCGSELNTCNQCGDSGILNAWTADYADVGTDREEWTQKAVACHACPTGKTMKELGLE